jgi:cystathionine beta-lyase
MTTYDFDTLPDRRPTESNKWNFYPPDVLPMWVADMDFCSPEPVIQALRQRVEHGVFGYPMVFHNRPDENPRLYEAIVAWLAERHGWQVKPEEILLIPGVVVGFNLAAHTLAVPDGAVLVQTPVYEPILYSAKWSGARSQDMTLHCNVDGSYSIDMQAFEAAITPETRLFTLCNPHNPVGRVFHQEELEAMAQVCLRHGVTICSDEIHADLVYPPHRHIPIASLDSEIANHTITLMAPSKTFNLAGLQFAFAVIPNPELRRRYLKANPGLVGWVNLMGLTAAQAAYLHGREWLDQLLPYLEANRDLAVDFVNKELPGVRLRPSEGTYLAWLDCRQAANRRVAADPYIFFLEEARVALNNGSNYGQGGQGFVRLNFGCPRSMLRQALERMKVAFHQAI